jgi:amino acid transporter
MPDPTTAGRARPVPAGPESDLVRAIGVLGLAAGIINITVGGGIFRLPASVGAALGAAAPLAYLACAVIMGLIVLAFAEAGSRVSLTGGPYAYVEIAFGPFAGFLCGTLVWVTGTFALAAVSTVLVDNVGRLVPPLGGRAGGALLLVGVFGFFAAVNIQGVRQGARLNTAFTVAKLLPLVFLAVAGAFAVRAESLAVVAAPSAAEVARTSMLLIFAFAGLESALVPSGEVKDPARTVPRALIFAMLGITALYVVLQVVAQGVLGADLASQETPLAEAAGRAVGGWGRTLLLVGASISMLGYVGGMTLAIPRALFAFARDGFLPARLAAVHDVYRTPHVAIAVQATVACLFALTGTFEGLAIVANLAILATYAMCCLAAWALRRRGVSQGGTPIRVPLGGVLPWLALAAIAWLLTSIRLAEWTALGIALGVATIIYFATLGRRRASATTAG